MDRFCLVSFAIFFSSVFMVFGQTQNTPESDTTLFSLPFNSSRSNGMGGNHAALADDFETIFVNPSGFTTAEDQSSVAVFDLTLHDIDTTLRLIGSGFSDPAIYAARIKNHYEFGLNSNGPLMIGSIKGNSGWGILNRQYLKTWWDRNNIFVINANVIEEIAFYIGRSFPIKNFEETVTFTPGFTISPKYRVVFAPRDVLVIDFRHILENLQDQPLEFQMGIGASAGILLSFSDMVYFSAVFNDLLSPLYVIHYTNFSDYVNEVSSPTTSVAFLKPSYDFSVCFRTKNVFSGEIVRDLVFALDYHLTNDSLENADRDLLLDFGAGLELQLLRAFWIRVGWQQMLPSAGFSVNFDWVKLDMAVFGETFGNQPSDYQSISFSLGFSFRF
jgi:hypothetical protein